ncbi:MAG: TraR/DksA C4-type zinc finger protein, partial [Sneathiellales bacterium]|nr:TraR/DksA C4-type zinc finger protein [Sneathiellales bacterium]
TNNMLEQDRLQLIALAEQRISELQETLTDTRPVAEKKQNQAGDAAANLDLTINTSVDEKILSEHKLELAQLTKNAAWLKTDEAGICAQCGCDIPVARLKAVLTTRQCVACASTSN